MLICPSCKVRARVDGSCPRCFCRCLEDGEDRGGFLRVSLLREKKGARDEVDGFIRRRATSAYVLDALMREELAKIIEERVEAAYLAGLQAAKAGGPDAGAKGGA